MKTNGLLQIGVEVPSKDQVAKMQEMTKGTGQSIAKCWETNRDALVREFGRTGAPSEARNCFVLNSVVGKHRPIKVSDLHDFAWTRGLWRKAALETLQVAATLTVVYLVVGYLGLAYLDDSIAGRSFDGITGWYFLSATLSTVGLGDYAPEAQMTRAFAIFLIPFGLVIIGLGISFLSAYNLSLPFPEPHDEGLESQRARDYEALLAAVKQQVSKVDLDSDGRISRAEMVAAAPALGLSASEAEDLFDDIDHDHDGFIEPSPKVVLFFQSIPGRLLKLALRLYAPVVAGAIFFKAAGPEGKHLTWVDSFYFAVVICTSVG